jgi:hypothetical protein
MVFKLTDYLDKRKVNTQSVPVVKEANQIINEFVKTVNKDLIAGDLSKTPTVNNLITQKYPKNVSKRRQLEFQVKKLSEAKGFDSRVFFQNKKLELAQKLVTENNLALKYDPDGKKGIFKKLGGEGTRAGQSGYTKQLYNILDTLDTADDKVVKALDVIIEQDLPLKSIKDAAQYKQSRGILNQMISEISGVGTDNLKTRLKKSKYYTKDFQDTINYINKIGRQHQDFEGIKFSEAFEFGKTRLAGAAELEGRNLLSFYKDPNTNITNYAFRHWDRTNFNNQPSRVKLYDKKKVIRKPDGSIVPKKGVSLEDAELKWKAGMKVKTKDLIFSYDGSELFDNTTLRTKGPTSGLFDEVYKATKDYYTTYNKPIPDPKKPGTSIKFGELMERDFGKNALAIGHNAPGGIKAEPFTNFEIQTQQMNNALYNATKNIKSKELQKRVIQNIYGDLKGLTGEKYLQEFIKQPPVTTYRQAVTGVKPEDLKTTKVFDELVTKIDSLPKDVQTEICRNLGAKNLGGVTQSCKVALKQDPVRAVNTVEQSIKKFPVAKVGKVVRALRGVKSFLTGTLGPGALALEAAFAVPFGLYDFATGKDKGEIISNLTFGLGGRSEEERMKELYGDDVYAPTEFEEKGDRFYDLERLQGGTKGQRIRSKAKYEKLKPEFFDLGQRMGYMDDEGNITGEGVAKFMNDQVILQNRQIDDRIKQQKTAKERKEKFGLTGLEIPEMKSGGLMNLTRTTPPKRSLNKDSQGLASLPEYDR